MFFLVNVVSAPAIYELNVQKISIAMKKKCVHSVCDLWAFEISYTGFVA